MSHAAKDTAATAALSRFSEAIDKAQRELREDTNRCQLLHTTLRQLCEDNAELQSQVKSASWDRRLEALHKEQCTLEQQNTHLHEQLASNNHYMEGLRAARATVEAKKETVKAATQAARESFIATALQVHAEVLVELSPAQSLAAWGANKSEAEQIVAALEGDVAALRTRAAILQAELKTLKSGHTCPNSTLVQHSSSQAHEAPNEESTAPLPPTGVTRVPPRAIHNEEEEEEEAQATPLPDERQTLLDTLAAMTALCARHAANELSQQRELTAQRDALRGELAVLCERVEELDGGEQAAHSALRKTAEDYVASNVATPQESHCRSCGAHIVDSFL